MKKITALLLALCLLLALAACGGPSGQTEVPAQPDSAGTEQTPDTAEPDAAGETDLSEEYEALRQKLELDGYVCGAAYLGFCGDGSAEEAARQMEQAGYAGAYPVLSDLPQAQRAAWAGPELFCVVPADPAAPVTVERLDPKTGEPVSALYASETGEPMLVFANENYGNVRVRVGAGESALEFPLQLIWPLGVLELPGDGTQVRDFTLYEGVSYNEKFLEDPGEKLDKSWLEGQWSTEEFEDGEGGVRTCTLVFFGDNGMGYWYEDPYFDEWTEEPVPITLEFFDGTWECVTDDRYGDYEIGDMIFRMERYGGVYANSPESRSFFGVYRAEQDGEAIRVTHVDGDPLLPGMENKTVEFFFVPTQSV